MGYADRGMDEMVREIVHPVDIRDMVGAGEPTESLGEGLKKVTPALVLLAVVSGAAIAVGSGAVNRYLWKK